MYPFDCFFLYLMSVIMSDIHEDWAIFIPNPYQYCTEYFIKYFTEMCFLVPVLLFFRPLFRILIWGSIIWFTIILLSFPVFWLFDTFLFKTFFDFWDYLLKHLFKYFFKCVFNCLFFFFYLNYFIISSIIFFIISHWTMILSTIYIEQVCCFFTINYRPSLILKKRSVCNNNIRIALKKMIRGRFRVVSCEPPYLRRYYIYRPLIWSLIFYIGYCSPQLSGMMLLIATYSSFQYSCTFVLQQLKKENPNIKFLEYLKFLITFKSRLKLLLYFSETINWILIPFLYTLIIFLIIFLIRLWIVDKPLFYFLANELDRILFPRSFSKASVFKNFTTKGFLMFLFYFFAFFFFFLFLSLSLMTL